MINRTLSPRLLVSIAGEDGHAPLHELAAQAGWTRAHETPPDGWTYRAEGFAQVAVVRRLASLTGDRVLSLVLVPTEDGTNVQWAGMVAALTAAGAVQAHWSTLAELEADPSTLASEVRALPWPWRDYAPEDDRGDPGEWEPEVPAVLAYGEGSPMPHVVTPAVPGRWIREPRPAAAPTGARRWPS